jgi:hypothetical protein
MIKRLHYPQAFEKDGNGKRKKSSLSQRKWLARPILRL